MNKQSFIVGSLVVTFFGAFLLSCVVPADSLVETLHVERSGSTDTLAPYGGIILSFSLPANDSTLPRFDFNPPFFSYTVTMNASRDSAQLAWSEPLAGTQRYVIRVGEFRDKSGDVLPCDDSIVFVTCPTEKEPNDKRETADTLATNRWGAIATVNDTDWFAAHLRPGNALVLNSAGSQTSLAVVGRNGVLGPERLFRKSDTLVIDTMPSALIIAVFAYHRSVGGHYELSLVTSK